MEQQVEHKVFNHQAGLFVLFFTEMWERFSFYGMRGLLVLFLTSKWHWSNAEALALYGNYTMGVYLTPVLGGIIADRYIGYRKSIVLGAAIMTLGHIAMSIETNNALYLGLSCLIIGNGLFKPNITSILSQMYKIYPEKKDAAFSIFYMGVNAGAFLGMLLCGYIGEKVSWGLGFGLASIFMFLALLQFYFSQNIFGSIGLVPRKRHDIIHELEEVTEILTTEENGIPKKIARDRMVVVFILFFFTLFFWAASSQGGGSMTLFAEKYTQRVLSLNFGWIFKWADLFINLLLLSVIVYILIRLFRRTYQFYKLGNIILLFSFLCIIMISIWRINREFSNTVTTITTTWFGTLNALFIIIFSPFFSKWWNSRFNPSAAIKFSIGLILLGIGFSFLAYGAMGLELSGAKVSIIWLVLAYLFHTLGELTLAPVGLSYVSKLVPAKWIGLMFGLFYFFMAMGNKLAGQMGSMMDKIKSEHSISFFFLIFTIIPIFLGMVLCLMNPLMKRMMHGVK